VLSATKRIGREVMRFVALSTSYDRGLIIMGQQ